MLRTSTVLLRPAAEEERKLQELAEASSVLWNIANYERRGAFFEHSKVPSYSTQCRSLKNTEAFRRLGTCKAQALLQKLDESWKSFWALLRLKKRGRLPPHIRRLSPPRYRKKDGKRTLKGFYVRNDGWRMSDSAISVSRQTSVPYSCGQLWVGKQGRLEVVRDSVTGKWYAHVPVEVQQPPRRTSSKRASLDLGICNLAALYIENERPVIYSGRAVLSDWVYRTKKIAERQSRLPRRKHTSRQISIAYRKRQRRLGHAVNSMLRDVFERLEASDVGELIIGDLSHIRDEANHGDAANQKLHNFWVFNMMAGRIYELGDEYGIAITKVSERDTSKTCCLCGRRHNGRIERGLMVCREAHRSVNADVNGAVNIMKVAVNRFPGGPKHTEEGTSGSRLMAQPLLKRWNYDEWL